MIIALMSSSYDKLLILETLKKSSKEIFKFRFILMCFGRQTILLYVQPVQPLLF